MVYIWYFCWSARKRKQLDLLLDCNRITFDFVPKFVMVSTKDPDYRDNSYDFIIWIPGIVQAKTANSYYANLTQNGNTLSWYSTGAAGQLNTNGDSYYWVAIG